MRSSSDRSAAVNEQFVRSLWTAMWSWFARRNERACSKLLEVTTRRAESRQRDAGLGSHLVLEIHIHRPALLLVDQADEITEATTH
jgi:hypothetical protein